MAVSNDIRSDSVTDLHYTENICNSRVKQHTHIMFIHITVRHWRPANWSTWRQHEHQHISPTKGQPICRWQSTVFCRMDVLIYSRSTSLTCHSSHSHTAGTRLDTVHQTISSQPITNTQTTTNNNTTLNTCRTQPCNKTTNVCSY